MISKSLVFIALASVPIISFAGNTLYEEVVYSTPQVGNTTEVYLGDRMLSQQVGEWKECITPKKTYSKKPLGGANFVYKAGEPMCKVNLDSKYYTPTYANAEGNIHPVRWRKKGDKSSLCACPDMGLCAACIKKLSEEDVEDSETFIFRQNSFQQTLEYAGRSNDILKFNYSEFTNGFARQAFTREFQVDLSEGNIAAYKGAIIEILDATNVQIKYKVIRNFTTDI